jgi:RNA polymerase sigma-70 factor (ECF subfamily)
VLPNDTIAALYAAHGPRLYRYAVLLLADRTAAEDAVQDVFVQLARAFRDRSMSDVTFAYLATTLRNTCYSMLRRRRGGPFRPAGQVGLIEPATGDASEEERLLIEQVLRRLPAEQREVVYLKVFEGMTFQEIADRCGIGINTAGSRYRYGIEALRRALAPGEQSC